MAKKIASISKSRNGQYYSEMLTGGKTVHTSETYTRKSKAENGVVSTVNNILNAIGQCKELDGVLDLWYLDRSIKLTSKDLAPLFKDLTAAPKSKKAATGKGGKK